VYAPGACTDEASCSIQDRDKLGCSGQSEGFKDLQALYAHCRSLKLNKAHKVGGQAGRQAGL
jgi:hypothetical protein